MHRLLEANGLKTTAPRLKILNLFKDLNKSHLSAYDIMNQLLARGEKVSNSTVYRVLSDLESSEILTKCKFGDSNSIYKLNDGKQHDYFVCKKCGRIESFHEPQLEKLQNTIADQFGFEKASYERYIYGQCCNCQQHAATQEEPMVTNYSV